MRHSYSSMLWSGIDVFGAQPIVFLVSSNLSRDEGFAFTLCFQLWHVPMPVMSLQKSMIIIVAVVNMFIWTVSSFKRSSICFPFSMSVHYKVWRRGWLKPLNKQTRLSTPTHLYSGTELIGTFYDSHMDCGAGWCCFTPESTQSLYTKIDDC